MFVRREAAQHDDAPGTLVCWSRMQAEAGQGLERIVERKELERRASGGTFLWGVGNAPGAEPARLARAGVPITAVFSVMKSKPKPQDAQADDLHLWRAYIDERGVERPLPTGALVTSRVAAGRPERAHYALMCRANTSLELGDHGSFNPRAFRNVGGRGAPVGASQVTALLRLADPTADDNGDYRVNIGARLTSGYWVRLTNPVRLGRARVCALLASLEEVGGMSTNDWLDLVAAFRRGNPGTREPTLFESSACRIAPAAAVL